MKKQKIKLKNQVKNLLRNKTILITGGAGSIGSEVTKRILNYPVKALRVIDIDEYALFRLKRGINDKRLRPLLGSILDKDRLELACDGVDIIIHAAAIKNIEISEYNPIETIEVNINGTVNMIKMAMKYKPEKFLYLSTDKSVEPSTLYGTTKQIGERLTSWAGKHTPKLKCSSIRFGNVFESRGNVMEIWKDQFKNNLSLSITDKSMSRYFFHVDEAADFILDCLLHTNKGEVFVPKMKSYKIKELASKISKKHKIIGIRRGEKISEILITDNEKRHAENRKNMWILRPLID